MSSTGTVRRAAIAVCLGACAANMARGTDNDGVPARRTVITAINESPSDVRVFVELGSTAYPLGRVEAFQKRRFKLPIAVSLSVVKLRIQPFAGRQSFTTPDVTLEPLRTFELRIMHPLAASQILVR